MREAKYIRGVDNIAKVLENGIVGMNTDEERTIVQVPTGGSYAFRTGEFNSLASKNYDSPFLAAETGLAFSYKNKKEDGYKSPFEL